MSEKLNLLDILSNMKEYFSPKIIGEVNGVYVKLAKVKGQDVPWHTRKDEDELFYIIKGKLTMENEGDKSIDIEEGELYIVEKGIKHRVHSDEECCLMLVENKITKHTGEVQSPITKSIDDQRY